MTEKSQSFEASLQQLEAIVKALEDGEKPLDESLELFEKGVRLSRDCRKRLDEAERKIQILLEDEEGNIELEDFPGEE